MRTDFELIYQYAKAKNTDALTALLEKGGVVIDTVAVIDGFSWPSPACKLAAEGDKEAVDILQKLGAGKENIFLGTGLDQGNSVEDILYLSNNNPELVTYNDVHYFLCGLVLAGRFQDLQRCYDFLIKEHVRREDTKTAPKQIQFNRSFLKLSLSEHIAFYWGNGNHDLQLLEKFCQTNQFDYCLSTYQRGLARGGHLNVLEAYRSFIGLNDKIISGFAEGGHFSKIEEYYTKGYVGIKTIKNILQDFIIGRSHINYRELVYLMAHTENPEYRKQLADIQFTIKDDICKNRGDRLALALVIHEAMKNNKMTYEQALKFFKPDLEVSSSSMEDKQTEGNIAIYSQFYRLYTCYYDLQKYITHICPTQYPQLDEKAIKLIKMIKRKAEEMTDSFLLDPTKINQSEMDRLSQLNTALSSLLWIFANYHQDVTNQKMYYVTQGIELNFSNKNPEELLQNIKVVSRDFAEIGISDGWKALGIFLMGIGAVLSPLGVGVPIAMKGYDLFFRQGQDIKTNLEEVYEIVEKVQRKSSNHPTT